jgi:hypothetical protein
MSLLRWFRLCALLGVASLLSSAPGHAAFRPKVVVQHGVVESGVLVNGRLVARLRTENAGLEPAQRAELVAERLRAAIGRGLAPSAVGTRRVGEGAAVTVGSTVLFLATRSESHANQTRPALLAKRWALRLREALALPGLTLARSEVVVPFQEVRSIRIGGVARGEIRIGVREGHVASAAADIGNGVVTVRGLTPGMTVATVARDGASVTLHIIVKKYAGEVTRPVTAEVTGRPAPPDLVVAAALERYPEALALEPGASARLLAQPVMTRTLDAEDSVMFKLSVALEGKALLPRKAVVTVFVRNRALPRAAADVLFYSNDPEQVSRFGVLYAEQLEADAPARLLYHHQNRMGRAFYLAIDLINTGKQPARVQVIEGAAEPIVDTVLVGHRAGARYVLREERDVGSIVEIPARTRRTILAQRVAPPRTASGIYGLRPLSGPGLTVQVIAAEKPVTQVQRPAGSVKVAFSEHVYPRPNKVIRSRYRVGERWAFVAVGRSAIDGRHPKRRLDGNYGVFYDIALEIENPTDVESTVNLVLSAEAGEARGVFLVEGHLIEVPDVRPPAEFVLGSFVVRPHARGAISIRTLPVAGSNYPVTLVARTRRPDEPQHRQLSFRAGTARLMETEPNEINGN